MGDCIYVADFLGFRERGHAVRVMPSEQWMDPAEAGRVLAKDHFANTTTGVWFYEGDMIHEPAKVQASLRALADWIGTPEFEQAYLDARSESRTGRVTIWRPKP